uniref:Orf785 protein n=1 Tax=Allomyces macrogynus TaxID=28583 RepID=Q33759_ALLMA
ASLWILMGCLLGGFVADFGLTIVAEWCADFSHIIETEGFALLHKSYHLPDAEMARGPEHVINTIHCPCSLDLEVLLDRSIMVSPFIAGGASLNPVRCCNNTNLIESSVPDQSSDEANLITPPSTEDNSDVPKIDISHKESTARFPKGSNPYGDGVPIVGCGRAAQSVSEVGQRNYSTDTDAVKIGTGGYSKLVKLANGKFTGLYDTIMSIEFLLLAYRNIKSKAGNMTPGPDDQTLDGITPGFFEDLIKSLKNESFRFKSVKRTFKKKTNGKMRPLGIPAPRDKIVQEAMRILLEFIFEPIFSDFSHGFRPQRSCHTALKEVSKWNGMTWCIEGDIKSFFDNVDHKILENFLREKIEDQRFIDLFWKLVRAGYLEKGVSFDSPLGVPQGGIISPLLSNIYLHAFDMFMEKVMSDHSSDSKSISKVNPKMVSYSNKLSKLNKQYQDTKDPAILKEIRALRLERNKIPSRIRTGTRVRYVRYADDWLVGIIGPRELAVSLKEMIASFLAQELKITLSPEKTKISHFGKDLISFLGVNLRIPKPAESKVVLRKGAKGHTLARVNHTRVFFYIPVDKILAKLAAQGFLKDYVPGGKIVTNAITKWIFLDHRSIISKYNSIINGFLSYYSFVDNLNAFHLIINYILVHSCAKTLARKFRLGSRAGAFKKFGGDLAAPAPSPQDKPLGLNLKKSYAKTNKFNIKTSYRDPTEVLNWSLRTLTPFDPCWVCGSEKDIEMHHVRHLRKGVDPKQKRVTLLMSQLNRKQIPVCRSCHLKIHKGLYNGPSIRNLK